MAKFLRKRDKSQITSVKHKAKRRLNNAKREKKIEAMKMIFAEDEEDRFAAEYRYDKARAKTRKRKTRYDAIRNAKK
tara:strand:+ start:843 stop:1073 length:231 start_codon:yes stop_codon:yes gene_type:complete